MRGDDSGIYAGDHVYITFPRMCGGDPKKFYYFGSEAYFSPHARGVIPFANGLHALRFAFPRMCGGDHTKKVCDI